MRRLHWRVYLTVVGALIAFLVSAILIWHLPVPPRSSPFEPIANGWGLVHGLHVGLLLTIIAAALAMLTYPITRGITARLARLEVAVRQFGAGNLASRVPVEGRDEVAALAVSFNDAAARIEQLVAAQRMLLANCSHELRTPLTRLRLAVEKLDERERAANPELTRNIKELDALIEEMLLASALDAGRGLERREPVDLLALAAEEAAHFDLEAEGAAAVVAGDPLLLRRLVRNLLENARAHAGGAAAVRVARDGLEARLIVEDTGPGVPEAACAKIFEPFYRIAATPPARAPLRPAPALSPPARAPLPPAPAPSPPARAPLPPLHAPQAGTGLGLAIVRQIAHAHRGTVVCEPRPGGGSRFVVTLPMVQR